MILNRPYPFIGASNIRLHPHSLVWDMRKWQDYNYWYCEIFSGTAFDKFPVDTVIPADVLTKIKTDTTTFLVVCNIWEGFHSIVEPLYKSLVFENNIPPNKIILMNESADLHLAVREYASNNNVLPFNVEWLTSFQLHIRIDKQNNKPVNTLEIKNYPKKFLNFNRRWRMHRPSLVALMIANNLLDLGYVSLGETDDNNNWQSVYWWIENKFKSDTELHGLLEANKDNIINTPPLYLDTADLQTNHIPLDNNTDYLYENSYFSIITETNFYDDQETGRFISEKTFKPIAQKHPFIITTVPKTLELLRSIGYNTFHPWINEEYDNELDDVQRLKKIVNEIKRLANMSDSEVAEFIQAVKPIVEHNFNVLMRNRIATIKTL